MSTKAASPRQAFFAQFAQKARECLKTNVLVDVNVPLILLTGGLRSPSHLQNALDAGHADLLGIGRGSLLCPDLPAVLRESVLDATANGISIVLDDEPFAHEPDDNIRLPSWVPQIPLIGAGVGAAWYNICMRRIATSQLGKNIDGKSPAAPLPAVKMSGIEVMVRMWIWIEWYQMLLGSLSVCCLAVLLCCL